MHKEDFRVIKQKGFYKLINGDCLEVMKGIPDKSIDCIVCDPPYGTTECKWDSIIPFEPMWEQYKRIIKDNGAILLFGSQPFTTELNHSNLKMFRYEWIWIKNNSTGFQLANKRPLKKHEIISVSYRKQPTYNPQGLQVYGKINRRKSTGDNWSEMNNNEYIQRFTNYPTQILEFGYDKEKLHPTQKPVSLLEYLVKTYTNEADVVLDNCMGSGSTGVACINTNRRFVGIELDEKYFKISCGRVKQALEYKNDYGDW